MINKRKPFFIKENFNLNFIICFAAGAVLGTAIAAFLVYTQLESAIEKAAFSSHLSLSSSSELFSRIIWDVNLWVAIMSIILGQCLIMVMRHLLEKFFRCLNFGLEELTRGHFSFRLPKKFYWIGGFLLKDFNLMAEIMDKRSKKIKSILDATQKNLESSAEMTIEEIKSTHQKLLEGISHER